MEKKIIWQMIGKFIQRDNNSPKRSKLMKIEIISVIAKN